MIVITIEVNLVSSVFLCITIRWSIWMIAFLQNTRELGDIVWEFHEYMFLMIKRTVDLNFEI